MLMQPNHSNSAQAVDLNSGHFSLSKPIRASDRPDLYRLTLLDRCGLNLRLRSIRSRVQATIGFDRNRNGRLEGRETIARTAADQSIATLSRSMRSGTYLIRVSPTQQNNDRYHLTLKLTGLRAESARHISHFAHRVLQLTNAFRQQNNLKPLRWNDRLAIAAQQHSQNMATQDFFAHQGLDGASAQARGNASGYSGGIGENIAAGQTTPKAVMQAWLNSPQHRANLFDPRYRDIGVGFFDNPIDRGLVNYRYYWAQNFGIPMG